MEHEDEMRRARKLHARLACERVTARYNKHYNLCLQVVSDIVDLTARIAEYREFTNKSAYSHIFFNFIEQ